MKRRHFRCAHHRVAPLPLSMAQQPQTAKPNHMDHKFDDPARYAKSFDDPARDAWQLPARVIDALQLKSGMKIADIGAGTGYFSMRLAKVPGVSVFAVDIEPKMVEYLHAARAQGTRHERHRRARGSVKPESAGTRRRHPGRRHLPPPAGSTRRISASCGSH